GIMVIIKARKALTLWLIFLLTAFFAFLTYYTAYYNKVLECGCFGDFLPMTPWQSFGKNVVLLILIGMLAIFHKHFIPSFSSKVENFIIIMFTAGGIAFSWYCYNYLPVIDFRPYKVGTDIKRDMKGGIPDVLKYYYTLKNKTSGETKEFDKFPENYQKDWDYVSSRTEVVKKGVEAKIHDFNITSLDGENYTDSALSNPNYSFFLVSSSITDANTSDEVTKKINDLYNECKKNHFEFICLTASGDKEIDAFKQKTHAEYPFYNTDDTQLRTMIRSNPGLIMIKAGMVIAMWHYHSLPDYKTLNTQYFHK
ncbi:MAG TPA: BT_3928 family protein, partial [Bacteroidia bacterium]|nr:BT_3928 family protein [Bacteroidia bacterium]